MLQVWEQVLFSPLTPFRFVATPHKFHLWPLEHYGFLLLLDQFKCPCTIHPDVVNNIIAPVRASNITVWLTNASGGFKMLAIKDDLRRGEYTNTTMENLRLWMYTPNGTVWYPYCLVWSCITCFSRENVSCNWPIKAVVSKFLVSQVRPHQIEQKTQLFFFN